MRGKVSFTYVKTTDQVADMLTKALPECKHEACCNSMGMRKI